MWYYNTCKEQVNKTFKGENDMNKLYFSNPQELIDFTLKMTQGSPLISFNEMTFNLTCCNLLSNNDSIEIYDRTHNLICVIETCKIKKINEYTIIKEWNKRR